MKVLFYESRPEWGGAQKCELEIIEGLEAYGIETIFVTSTQGPMIERLVSIGKEVYNIPIHSKIDSIRKDRVNGGILSKFILPLFMLPHFIKLIRFVVKMNPDIIYTSQFRSQLLIGWIGKILRKKVVWHIHGEEKLHNLLGKIALFTSSQRVVVSRKLNESYQSLFPNEQDKFYFIPNGVDVTEQKKHNGSNTIHFITVGALVEGKRQDLCIKACKELVDKGYSIHLHIVGEMPRWLSDQYKIELFQFVQQNGLDSVVTFHGWVEKPLELLALSDIFLLPSDTEGLPLSIIEAMGVGLPCIATNVGGVSELVIHEKTGLLIQKNSIEELIASMVQLVENKELRDIMGKAAFNVYKKHYTKKAFLEGVVGVLRTVNR